MTRKGERQGVSPPSVLADPVPAIASRFDRTNDLTAARFSGVLSRDWIERVGVVGHGGLTPNRSPRGLAARL